MPGLLQLLFPAHAPRARWNLVLSALFMIFLIVWSAPYFTISVHALGEDWGRLHIVHLVFHEAGHAIPALFTDNRPFVSFMGSGFQVLFPLFISGAFYFKNRDAYGAAVCLWWAGHATLDVAPYIADARALELPLLGGGTGREIEGHDWEFLLTHWNALQHDIVIGDRVAAAGRIVMVTAFAWGLATLAYEAWILPSETARPD